jgi:peptide chain release factor subunit 3
MGTVVLGKLQSGSLSKGDTLMLMPNKIKVVVDGILADDQERSSAQSGDNVKVSYSRRNTWSNYSAF